MELAYFDHGGILPYVIRNLASNWVWICWLSSGADLGPWGYQSCKMVEKKIMSSVEWATPFHPGLCYFFCFRGTDLYFLQNSSSCISWQPCADSFNLLWRHRFVFLSVIFPVRYWKIQTLVWNHGLTGFMPNHELVLRGRESLRFSRFLRYNGLIRLDLY